MLLTIKDVYTLVALRYLGPNIVQEKVLYRRLILSSFKYIEDLNIV